MNTAIILSGGRGKRMGASVSKQFIMLKNKPILYYTIKKFLDNKDIDNIVLVLPEDEIDYFKENILDKFDLDISKIVLGGKERQDSVYNGLKECKDSDIVLIHDGARPFVSDEIISNGIKFAKEYGAAAPGVMPKDTIKVKDLDSFSKSTPKRSDLVSVQTPQVFKYDLITKCHEKIKIEGREVTDDTMVVETYGNKVFLYDGEYTNIKITTPEDLILGEYLVLNN
ncbi:2-C-methyl-D-erythritol 4-phosphate cytidylyltransferase [Clostridium sp. LY3-2]|uniref:2-C-methyl-D-erythritol 4-phosphate cytidylyltransferase n=1 Tax=Clostridium sp. LY3-2 TaxID=2942482 RepID=UPI002152BA3F|nr:2-C-methyl-D-erythritol 4-phosphate cytidylyltransferase [Clostridium sp. LY3-2]MCR6516265.1 2-C-methyl-D-erythritol 4-phosphate cytidylyltransferase [Clostridium sp. LY3-2]